MGGVGDGGYVGMGVAIDEKGVSFIKGRTNSVRKCPICKNVSTLLGLIAAIARGLRVVHTVD